MDSEKQPEKNMNDINPAHLEPRVARLEVGLETLTRNVSEMATSIRENANATNAKIDQLAIAVTQAAAPKKTDWSMIISACLLMMAIGSAVFWPLNQTSQNNKQDICVAFPANSKTITLYKDGQPYAMPIQFRERMHDALRKKWKEKFPAK